MATVEDLFNVKNGHSLPLNKLAEADYREGIAFVSRTSRNNGVASWVKRIDYLDPEPAGSLTVCLRSRNHALSTFVQPRDFYTGYHVAILTPRTSMSIQEKLWWAKCIEANRYRFNFGRQANRTLSSLSLPDVVPDWVSEASVPLFELGASGECAPAPLATMTNLEYISFSELFKIHRGRNILIRERTPGSTPYVSATGLNNGVSDWIDGAPEWQAGMVTIASNGTNVGSAFYQPWPFIASGDVTILEPQFEAEPADLLFFCTIVRQDRYRWNYGRKWTTGRIRQARVKLPKNAGSVDWAWIREYMYRGQFGPMVLGNEKL